MQVREGGYDQKVNGTVNVVTAKTAEISQKTWGIMKGVMALASQKVEEYTKEGGTASWQRSESERHRQHQECGQESKGWRNSPGGNRSSKHGDSAAPSWDDWGREEEKPKEPAKGSESGDGWAGWDDGKDDGYDSYYYQSASSTRSTVQNGKSGTLWTEGGGFL